ncbi:MAG: hypothetical protein JWO59_1179, partial [Chloroflexi bacterium]|nr:hypothetical protein [Chloroflexota bacterium]
MQRQGYHSSMQSSVSKRKHDPSQPLVAGL